MLARIEALLDDAELAWIEALLPVGVRPRQLSVRTLLVGVPRAWPTGAPPISRGCTPPFSLFRPRTADASGSSLPGRAGPTS